LKIIPNAKTNRKFKILKIIQNTKALNLKNYSKCKNITTRKGLRSLCQIVCLYVLFVNHKNTIIKIGPTLQNGSIWQCNNSVCIDVLFVKHKYIIFEVIHRVYKRRRERLTEYNRSLSELRHFFVCVCLSTREKS
jgi:hypothetical protein